MKIKQRNDRQPVRSISVSPEGRYLLLGVQTPPAARPPPPPRPERTPRLENEPYIGCDPYPQPCEGGSGWVGDGCGCHVWCEELERKAPHQSNPKDGLYLMKL